jgi:hypothetical protein
MQGPEKETALTVRHRTDSVSKNLDVSTTLLYFRPSVSNYL